MTDTDTSNIGKAGKTHAERTQVNEMHKAGQAKAKRETHRRTHTESETWLALFRGGGARRGSEEVGRQRLDEPEALVVM